MIFTRFERIRDKLKFGNREVGMDLIKWGDINHPLSKMFP